MNPTDKILYKTGLPYAPLAEQMILGGLVTGKIFPVKVQAVLSSDDFSTEAHRKIFKACCSLSDKGITVDRVVLADELDGNLASVGGLTYLSQLELSEEPPDLENFVNAIKSASLRRKLIHACEAITQQSLLSHDSSDTLQWAENLIAKIGDGVKPLVSLQSPSEVIQAAPGGANAFFYPKHGPQGILSPWPRLNDIIGGFRPGQLIILGAYTGIGKSAAAAQAAQYTAQCGTGVALFSLEMSSQDILVRMICQRASINSHKFQTGCLSDREQIEFQRCSHEITELPLRIDDTSGATVMAVQTGVRKLQATTHISLVVIDYLQLMDTVNRHENRVQQVTEITRGLKRMAVEQQVTVLALSQLNRSSQDGNPPSLKHLRESGSIEQDADKVILLHQPKKDNEEGIRSMAIDTEFRVEKNRGGPTGKVTLLFQRGYTRFDDIGGQDDRP